MKLFSKYSVLFRSNIAPFTTNRAANRGFHLHLLVLSLCLFSCISDGPNHSGGGFLEEQGLIYAPPLDSIYLSHLPVDTFWTVDLPYNRLGELSWPLGKFQSFESQARMAFAISDSTFTDSISNFGSLSLILSLIRSLDKGGSKTLFTDSLDSALFIAEYYSYSALDTQNIDTWKNDIRNLAYRFVDKRDSLITFQNLKVARESIWVDLRSTVKKQVDTVRDSKGKISILANGDTSFISYYTVGDSTLKLELEELRKHLLGDKHRRQFVMLNLTMENVDSSDLMLRFIGKYDTKAKKNLQPHLRRSNLNAFVNAFAENQVVPLYLMAGDVRAINTVIQSEAPKAGLSTGKVTSLLFEINRDSLLHRISTALNLRFPNAKPGKTWDSRYFIPYAELSLPLQADSISIEGDVAIQAYAKWRYDSNSVEGQDIQITVNRGAGVEKYPLLKKTGINDRQTDTLLIRYLADLGNGAQFEFAYQSDTTKKDTVRSKIGERTEIKGLANIYYRIEADNDLAIVSLRFSLSLSNNARDFYEPVFNYSPNSNRPDESVARNPQLLIEKGSEKLTLRTRHYFQELLNRSHLSTYSNNLDYSLQVIPVSSGLERDVTLSYPVFGTIPFVLENGQLYVDVRLYLYQVRN